MPTIQYLSCELNFRQKSSTFNGSSGIHELIRLWFNNSQKQVGLFDNAERKETKVAITKLDELYQLADRLKATAVLYG